MLRNMITEKALADPTSSAFELVESRRPSWAPQALQQLVHLLGRP
jgi:hypothetical protein